MLISQYRLVFWPQGVVRRFRGHAASATKYLELRTLPTRCGVSTRHWVNFVTRPFAPRKASLADQFRLLPRGNLGKDRGSPRSHNLSLFVRYLGGFQGPRSIDGCALSTGPGLKPRTGLSMKRACMDEPVLHEPAVFPGKPPAIVGAAPVGMAADAGFSDGDPCSNRRQ